MEFKHKPVLLKETIDGLNIKEDGIYVDGTLGGAGHSKEILKKLEYIEVRICHLLNIFSIYKNPHNPNYELIRKLRNHFTRKRKIEKAELVRKEKEINYLKMIKKINNRNNRFIFLERRKIAMHNYAGWTHEKSKNKSSNRNKVYLPTFDDFMFDYNRTEKYNLTSDNDFGSFK